MTLTPEQHGASLAAVLADAATRFNALHPEAGSIEAIACELEYNAWPSAWDDTSCGFGIGGQMITHGQSILISHWICQDFLLYDCYRFRRAVQRGSPSLERMPIHVERIGP